MGLEEGFLECPFCGKGIINYLRRLASYRHQTTYGAGKGHIFRRVNEVFIITSEACPSCNKTREDIEKKLRDEGVM